MRRGGDLRGGGALRLPLLDDASGRRCTTRALGSTHSVVASRVRDGRPVWDDECDPCFGESGSSSTAEVRTPWLLCRSRARQRLLSFDSPESRSGCRGSLCVHERTELVPRRSEATADPNHWQSGAGMFKSPGLGIGGGPAYPKKLGSFRDSEQFGCLVEGHRVLQVRFGAQPEMPAAVDSLCIEAVVTYLLAVHDGLPCGRSDRHQPTVWKQRRAGSRFTVFLRRREDVPVVIGRWGRVRCGGGVGCGASGGWPFSPVQRRGRGSSPNGPILRIDVSPTRCR